MRRGVWRNRSGGVTGAPARFSFVTTLVLPGAASRTGSGRRPPPPGTVPGDRARCSRLWALQLQYRQNPNWSAQLHYDNLKALADRRPVRCHATLARYMRTHGRKRRPKKAGEAATAERREQYEIRS